MVEHVDAALNLSGWLEDLNAGVHEAPLDHLVLSEDTLHRNVRPLQGVHQVALNGGSGLKVADHGETACLRRGHPESLQAGNR